MTDTTGQLVMRLTDSMTRIEIARDGGSYEGAIAELNVRMLDILHTLKLNLRHAGVRAIFDRGEGYGCGWGEGSSLYPITEAEMGALVAAAAPVSIVRQDDAAADKYDREYAQIEHAMTLGGKSY